ncbi:MAG: hypothetical protein ABFS38_17055 [Bacteroidota bacterium]
MILKSHKVVIAPFSRNGIPFSFFIGYYLLAPTSLSDALSAALSAAQSKGLKSKADFLFLRPSTHV